MEQRDKSRGVSYRIADCWGYASSLLLPVYYMWLKYSMSGPTSTSQSADDDEGLRGTGWGEGGPVYLET